MYQSMERRGRHWRHDVEHNTREIDLSLALNAPTSMFGPARIAQGAARIPSPPDGPGLSRTQVFPVPARAQVPVPLRRALPVDETQTARLGPPLPARETWTARLRRGLQKARNRGRNWGRRG